MSGEQAIFNLQIKKKSGLSLNPDIHHSKVFSSAQTKFLIFYYKEKTNDSLRFLFRTICFFSLFWKLQTKGASS